MLKRIFLSLIVVASTLFVAGPADADVRVQGYYRSNGTYVQSHYRSNPDSSFRNNWSTYPNINPYTGQMGTRRTPSYSGYRSYYRPSSSYWRW